MIYYLLYPLHDELNALNVLRYVPFRALAATMTSLLFTFFMYPWFIRALQAKQENANQELGRQQQQIQRNQAYIQQQIDTKLGPIIDRVM